MAIVSRSLKAHILLVIMTFVWGSTFVLIKSALADSTPMLLNAVRMAGAAAILALIYHRQLAKISRGVVWASFVIGTFLWIGYEAQTVGLVYTSASKSAFLTGLSVILVPVLLALIWRRHVNRYTLMGVGAAFVGLYLLTVPPAQGGLMFSSINRGDLLTLLCAVAFAIQIIFVGRSAQRYPFEQLVTLEIAFCAMWMWLSVPIAERGAHMRFTPPVIWSLLICGLIGTVVAFIVQAWAQQFTPPTHTALIFSLEPVFAAGTSYVLLGERLGGRGLVGGALILGGVLLSEVLGTVVHPEAELREELQLEN